jgi:hypothetical protein
MRAGGGFSVVRCFGGRDSGRVAAKRRKRRKRKREETGGRRQETGHRGERTDNSKNFEKRPDQAAGGYHIL